MAVVIKRTDLLGYFEKGNAPSQAQFAAFINAIPMMYTETVAIVANTDLTVTHGMGESAKMVQVIDSNGVSFGVTWRLDPSDPTNQIIINVGKAYTDAVVSILSK